MMAKRPHTRVQDGFTCIDEVVIQLTYGLCARPVAVLCRYCARYDELVYLARSDSPDEKCSAKSLMGLLSMEVGLGVKVNIWVEGSGVEAEELCLMVYAGLTTRGFMPFFGDE